MSLHRNERTNFASRFTATGLGRVRVLACGVLLVLAGALPVSIARAEDEPLTAAELEARIEQLAGKAELTDAQLAELVKLGQRYADVIGLGETKDGKATAAPKKPTPKPKPKVKPQAKAGKRKKGGVRRATPKPTPKARSKSKRSSSRGRKARKSPKPTPAPAGDDVAVALNMAAEQFLKPYDQREYEFSIKGGSYAQLIETFGRMASLPVIGKAPAGKVTFVSSEVMDFRTALGRVQMLLFKHPDQYWLRFKKDKNLLEIVRVTEGTRVVELDHIFVSVDAYRASGYDENELVLLLYRPESGSIADLEPLRDFMPDYFRVGPYGRGQKNALTIFGLIADINKYLSLIDIFQFSDEELRELKIIHIDFVKPSAALNTVKQLVNFGPSGGGAPPRKRKKGQASIPAAQAYGVTAIADDNRGTLMVFAMPKKIEEIERFLKVIDVPFDDEYFEPLVIRVKNTDAGKVMNLVKSILAGTGGSKGGASAKSKAAKARAARRKKGGVATPKAAAPLNSPKLTMLHWQPANSIILIGAEEEVAEASALIERFDVADVVETQFVELEHRSAAEACTLAIELLKASQSGAAPRVTCKPEANDSTLILAGPPREIAEMVSMIAKIDVDANQPPTEIFTLPLECMVPSHLVGILSAWDAVGGAGAARPAPAKGKKSKRKRTAARGATGKFQPDDAARTLRVICTVDEWEEDYKPLITRLDAEACGESEQIILEVTWVTVADAIGQLNTFFGSRKKGTPAGPTLLPMPRGIMVLNATANELATMKQVLAEIDVDPEQAGLVERRTFDLEYVAPAEIIPVLKALIDTGTPAAPPAKGKRRGKAATAVVSGSGVSFVEYGSRLWVSAPPRAMERIASLVEELDVAETERELRPYDFEVGTNVADLANTLRQLFPETGRVAASARTTKGKAKRKPARAGASAATGDTILFIPQPTMRRLFVSAPVDMFPEIEETIELIRPAIDERHGVVVRFFDITKAEPDVIADTIEPIMQIRIDELIEAGELPDPGKKRGGLLKLLPQAITNRLIVAAPKVLIPEIEELIERVEAGNMDDVVVEFVRLESAAASDMAKTISAMIGGAGRTAVKSRAAPRRAARGKGKNAKAAAKAPALPTVTPTGVTVVPLPSDDSLIVRGPRSEVDEVLGWIEMLDTPEIKDREMRVYQPLLADVEQLADDIMAMLDSGGEAKKKTEDDFFDDFSFGGPRIGNEIRLTTNYFTNTMVVWASPRKHAEIAAYIELYEDETITTSEDLPTAFIELQYADAYEAKYDLQEFIDAIWSGEKPKIDYIPFQNVLSVKSRNLEKDLPRVKEIIAEYIDTPDKAGGQVIKREVIKGALASDVVKELLLRLGGDVDVVVEGLEPDDRQRLLKTLTPAGFDNRTLAPCVLPSSIFQAVDALVASTAAQADGDEPAEKDEDAPRNVDLDEAVRRAQLLESLTESQADQGAAEPDAEAEQAQADTPKPRTRAKSPVHDAAGDKPAERPKVRIRIDPRTNGLIIEGMSRTVNDVRELIEEIVEEHKDAATGAPNIRVWQLEYVDPNAAAQVLEAMFNASSPRSRAAAAAQAAQLRAQQQQAARRRQQQQKQQQQQQAAGQTKGGDERGGRGEQAQQDQQQAKAAAPAQPSISVFPYPPLRAIIVKAPTEIYPAIEELVATIDRKTDTTTEFRFFQVHSQAASAVEEQLKTIFNIGQPRQAARQPRGRNVRGNAAAQQVAQMMQQQIDLAALGDAAGAIGSTASITITSNDDTNTVLVRGPKPVLDLSAEIIAKIEENAPPPVETHTYPLQYADVSNVVPQLKELFALGAKDQSYHPDNVQAVFLADTLNNAVIVRARLSDFERIEGVLKQIDVQSGPPEKAVTVAVTCGEAEKFAKLLEKIYGMGRRGKESGKKVQFVGDQASNTVVFTAPEELREEISKRITDMDATACGLSQPQFIRLVAGNASQVATVIQEAFGGGKGAKSRVRVSGDDATRQLVVSCPSELFPKIEQFARTLDVPPTNLDVKTYKLKYAKPSEVLSQMEKMFRSLAAQLRGKGVPIDAFAGTASDRANTITVAGGPITFAAVEKYIADVDIESEDTTIETLVVALNKTRAREVANTIKRLFPKVENGIDPPRAEANDSTNTIIVRGTRAQLDRINNEVIKKLEEFTKPGQQRETRVYRVARADLNSVRGVIATAFRLERGAAESERVDVAVETATQSIVVTAKPAKHDAVAKLIKDLDDEVDPATTRTTRVVTLSNADAGATVRSLREMFVKRGGRGQETISISSPQGSDAVLIKANDKEFAEISAVIATLDAMPDDEDRAARMFTLKFTNADEMQPILEDYLRRPGSSGRRGRRGGDDLIGDIRITTIPSSNSIVATGTAEGLERVGALVAQVDVEVEDAGNAPKIIRLEKALASDIEPTLTQIFIKNAGGRRGGGRRGSGGAASMVPVIVANDAANTLIVRANPTDFSQIERLVQTIDLEETDFSARFKIVQIAAAFRAGDIAATVEQAVQQAAYKPGATSGRRGGQSEFSADPIEASNSLILSGDPKQLEVALAMIDQIQKMGPAGGKVTKIIPVPNRDPEEIKRVIEEMINDNKSQGSRSRGRRGRRR